MLENIRIILVETSHAGNIGSVARAMLNMGLNDLWLVNPQCSIDDHALNLACHAKSVVENANITATLTEALEGVNYIVATSARVRRFNLPLHDIKSTAETMIAQSRAGYKTAIIFGRERTGLYNDELLMCHAHAYIPTNPEYNSLNLAQAVQVVSYELRQAMLAIDEGTQAIPEQNHYHALASASECEHFYRHIAESMVAVGFLNPENPGHVVEKVRRLFQRSQLESQEINILRGFLSAVAQKLEK